jgi:hypothetical protein
MRRRIKGLLQEYIGGFTMKKMSVCFGALAILLSNIMCVVVAYNYSDMLWGIQYAGYSAPVWTAFLSAIPFVIGIAICIVLAIIFKKKCA